MNPLRLLAPVLACALAVPAVAAPVYTMTELGFAGTVYSLNSDGDVVGTTRDKNGLLRAFVGSEGEVTRLYPPNELNTVGQAINDLGVVVVNQLEVDRSSAMVVAGGTFTNIGSLGYTTFVQASAINNAGQVTGSAGHAFLYQPGSGMADLGTLGGPGSWGRDVNNRGNVVGGSAFDTGGAVRAFIYRDGAMQDLGSLGGRDSEAFALNDSDVAVGWANRPGDHLTRRAVLFSGGSVTELGSLSGTGSSSANDINNLGEIVGSATMASGAYHAFLYGNGTMLDLNDLIDPASGLVLTGGLAINDTHEILAFGKDAGGGYHSVLLTLADGAVSPVPEPGVYAMLLAGLGLAGVGRVGVRRIAARSPRA